MRKGIRTHGIREGLAAARSRGRVGGRPGVATEEIIRAARDLLPDPGRSITSIAKLLGVSPGTLYNHIPDLCELRGVGASSWRGTAPADRMPRTDDASIPTTRPQCLLELEPLPSRT
ncbi:hypothetical protein [Streptomyces sp. NPDC005262]|uniref:hypothetical protein n=1 Tax=Streptomyces sp. NPDC005262 TaxID=3364710 RepID=UPI0036739E3C